MGEPRSGLGEQILRKALDSQKASVVGSIGKIRRRIHQIRMRGGKPFMRYVGFHSPYRTPYFNCYGMHNGITNEPKRAWYHKRQLAIEWAERKRIQRAVAVLRALRLGDASLNMVSRIVVAEPIHDFELTEGK